MKVYGTFTIALFILLGLNLQAQVVSANITVQQADSLIQARALDADLVILDIRTDMEFNAGHLENAIQINFLKRTGKLKMWKLDRSKAYIIYCRSGKRSQTALDMMKQRKFKEVYNMLGGIKSWTKEGYAVVKEEFEDVEFEKGRKIKK